MPDTMDDELIQRWKRGDARATRALYEACRLRAYRLALALVSDQARAEELAHDALTRALMAPDTFDITRARFETWLHTIVVNACRDHHRKNQRFTWFREALSRLDRRTPPRNPETLATTSERDARVWRAVEALPMPLREAIVLRIWQDQTYREIAAIVGCPLRTAQSRVRLAISTLRTTLDEDDLRPDAPDHDIPHREALG